MDSVLDSLTWGDEPQSRARRSRKNWLRRGLLALTAVFVLGVLLSA